MKNPEIKELAELLHNAGMDAYSYPKGKSKWDWDKYRLKIAEELLKHNVRIVRIKDAPCG